MAGRAFPQSHVFRDRVVTAASPTFSMKGNTMKLTVLVGLASMTLSCAAFADGAQLFQEKGCWACHGKDGKTTLLPVYPKIAGQNVQYVERQIHDIKNGVRTTGNSAAMRGALTLVSESEIKDIADFVSKMKP
jgi:cytochrome c